MHLAKLIMTPTGSDHEACSLKQPEEARPGKHLDRPASKHGPPNGSQKGGPSYHTCHQRLVVGYHPLPAYSNRGNKRHKMIPYHRAEQVEIIWWLSRAHRLLVGRQQAISLRVMLCRPLNHKLQAIASIRSCRNLLNPRSTTAMSRIVVLISLNGASTRSVAAVLHNVASEEHHATHTIEINALISMG